MGVGLWIGWFVLEKHVPEGTRDRMRKAGSKVTEAYYWVVQKRVCIAYTCKADVIASSL